MPNSAKCCVIDKQRKEQGMQGRGWLLNYAWPIPFFRGTICLLKNENSYTWNDAISGKWLKNTLDGIREFRWCRLGMMRVGGSYFKFIYNSWYLCRLWIMFIKNKCSLRSSYQPDKEHPGNRRRKAFWAVGGTFAKALSHELLCLLNWEGVSQERWVGWVGWTREDDCALFQVWEIFQGIVQILDIVWP